jgi:hypothetical protein
MSKHTLAHGRGAGNRHRQVAAGTGRYPHLILSGHVHSYQRFTIDLKTRTIG